MQIFDLEAQGLRELNSTLHAQAANTNQTHWEIVNPKGSHAIAVGLDAPIEVNIKGSTGYYCAGMNKQATVHVHGSVGPGTAENMMSGMVVVEGDASQYGGATGHVGTLVFKVNASLRCGISMGCGEAGEALGDSLYEARLFVRGSVKSLGADCIEKEMRPEHIAILEELLERGQCDAKASEFKRYGSARQLYNFNIDNAY